ncbi:MAG: hypothetical protein AABN95_16165 [Acidobacteriota bacterium]
MSLISDGQVMIWSAAEQQFIPINLVGGAGIFSTEGYASDVVTVPAPTQAPTLSAGGTFYGSGTFVNTTAYLVAYTYVGWTGESQISPTSTFTCANGQVVAVLPHAPKATRAVGAKIYISDDAGATYHLANGPQVVGPIMGFGDESVFGGMPLRFNATGAAPPVANTAADRDGTAISNPTVAPVLTDVGKIATGQTYYGAFSYVGEDGTETALSPFSTSLTTAANGNSINFRLNEEPPNGAVFVNIYLGSAATIAAMKRQAQQPLHYVTAEVHSFNASGAAPSAGTPQSTVSAFQQAYDAGMEAGGGQVLVPPGPHDFKVPVILRLKNTSGNTVVGMRIQGTAGHDTNGSSSLSQLRYTGSTAGVEAVVFATQSLTWSDVDVADPNSRVKYGLAMCDYGVGGGSFTSQWQRAAFSAYAANGKGLVVSIQSRNGSSHTASEQLFDSVTFVGTAWAVDLHSSQTGNFRFHTVTLSSLGNADSANSGDARIATGGFNVNFSDYNSNGTGQYNFFLTQDAPHSQAGASGNLTLTAPYTENSIANFYVYDSAVDVNGGMIYVAHGNFGNSTGHECYAIYTGTASRITLNANERGAGNVWLNHSDAVMVQTGGDAMFRFGTDYFKQTSPSYSATKAALSVYGSGRKALVNGAGNVSYENTNDDGDIVLTPHNNVVVNNNVVVASGDVDIQAGFLSIAGVSIIKGQAAGLSVPNTGTVNSGDATTDAVINNLRTRLLQLESRLSVDNGILGTPVDLLTDLIAYWKLDEASGARNDSHGSNHLADNNTVTQATGKLTNAGQFVRANSEHLSIAHNVSLHAGGHTSIFGYAWVYVDGNQGTTRVIMGKFNDAVDGEYRLKLNTANKFQFEVYDGAASGIVVANTFGAVSTGLWYLVAFQHDAASDVIWIKVNNGASDTLSWSTGISTTSTADFLIGATHASGSPNSFWDGRIDGAGFGKGVLTAGKTHMLWNDGDGIDYPF